MKKMDGWMDKKNRWMVGWDGWKKKIIKIDGWLDGWLKKMKTIWMDGGWIWKKK